MTGVRRRGRFLKMWLRTFVIISRLFQVIFFPKGVLSIMEFNWYIIWLICRGKKNVKSSIVVKSSRRPHTNRSFLVVDRRRMEAKCSKVFHYQICKFVAFMSLLSSWLLKLDNNSATSRVFRSLPQAETVSRNVKFKSTSYDFDTNLTCNLCTITSSLHCGGRGKNMLCLAIPLTKQTGTMSHQRSVIKTNESDGTSGETSRRVFGALLL